MTTPSTHPDMNTVSAAVRKKQIEAADPAASVWVRANAGSGKTRVLVERLLRLLLDGTPPDQILALTFTKAAAAEMKDRLQRRMNLWAGCEDDDLEHELFDLTNTHPTPEQKRRARALFAVALETPGGLKIQTIHGFCQSVLERFSVEAGVPANFTIIEDQEAADLKAEATENLLGRIFTTDNADEQLAAALNIVIETAGEFGFASVINKALQNAAIFDRLFAGPNGLNRAIENLSIQLGLPADSDLFTVPALHDLKPQFDLDRMRPVVAAMADNGGARELERLKSWLPYLENQTADNLESFCNGFLKSDGGPLSKSFLISAKADKATNGFEVLVAIQQEVIRLVEARKAYATRARTAALYIVINHILQDYATAKSARGVLDYGDLIFKARNLLDHDGGAGWVLYKLDRGIDHILVDEAQDTSPDQWAIINALSTEFFAGDGIRNTDDPLVRPRTIFAVGDEKQSIYRFQGADPSGFARMAEKFGDSLKALEQTWRDIELEVSFRSTPAILRFVDSVFEQADAHQGLSASGGGTKHIAYRQDAPGKIVRWPMIDPPEKQEDQPWLSPVDAAHPGTPLNLLAKRIAQELRDWFNKGRILETKNRPVRPGDILILLNTRASKMTALVQALKNENIPVAGTDRMVLGEQMAVMDLMVLGDWALFPDDDLSLATILKGPFCNLTEDQLFDLAHNRAGTLWAALQDKADQNPGGIYAAARDWLASLPAKAALLRPYDFYAHVLDQKQGRKLLIWRLTHQAIDPINEFLARTISYEARRTASLQGFLHMMRQDMSELKRDMDRSDNAVRIMTIHGAKGLEAPIVILPDLLSPPQKRQLPDLLPLPGKGEGSPLLWRKSEKQNDALTNDAANAFMDEELAEYRRLLYVALTRAEDELYLCGYKGKKSAGAHVWADYVATPEPDRTELFNLVDGDDGKSERAIFEDQIEATAPGTSTTHTDEFKPAPLPHWAMANAVPEKPDTRPLAPSALANETDGTVFGNTGPTNSPLTTGVVDGDAPSPLLRGTLLHQLLETLPDIPTDARRDTAVRLLSRPAHNIPSTLVENWADEIMAVLENPDFAPLFAPGSIAEISLTGLVGKNKALALSGQIDRLAVTDDAVLIIDYKTNQPPPKRAEDVPETYIGQMAAYRALLRDLYPGKQVRAALLFTDSCDLITLSDDQMDKVASKITGLA